MSRPCSFAVLALASLLFTSIAWSQRRTGGTPTGTLNSAERPVELSVLITYPNSHRADDARFMIELLGTGGTPMNNRTFSGSDGRASFNVVPGTYRVKVSGQYIEDTISDQFTVFSGEFMHHETVSVNMKAPANVARAPGSTVSAAELHIPEKAGKEYKKGLESLSSQDFKKAESHFEKAIKEYPDFDFAYNSLGVTRMQLKNSDGAQQAFAKAVEINPKNVHAQRNLARLLLSEERWSQGESAARNALAAQPQDPEGLTLLAMAELNQGKYDQALADARRVHSSEKHVFPYAHLIAGRACEAKRLNEQAAAEYRAFLQESPNDADARIARDGLSRLQK